MSEYQYYEFQAVDRPLDQRELTELRALSSRATITPTRLVNVYNWGNFRGDPATLMETYFDLFVYIANWGTHQFMLRLPRRLLDLHMAERYCPSDDARARAAGDHVILEFLSEQEPDGWIDDGEGEAWMSALLPLRAELAAGDLRGLYLGWLLCAQSGLLDDDDIEPPPPPGLATPSAAQQALADFLRLDADLIDVAAEHSALRDETRPSRHALERWLGALAESEKTGLLLRLVEGGDPHLRGELLQRFRAETTPAADRAGAGEPGRRTVGQLLAAAARRADARRRAEAERAAQERARREREQAAARAKRLEHLAAHEAEAWQHVDVSIAMKRPADYDVAVQALTDLRDLYAQTSRDAAFAARLGGLREQHARKLSLMERLDRAGLGGRSGAG